MPPWCCTLTVCGIVYSTVTSTMSRGYNIPLQSSTGLRDEQIQVLCLHQALPDGPKAALRSQRVWQRGVCRSPQLQGPTTSACAVLPRQRAPQLHRECTSEYQPLGRLCCCCSLVLMRTRQEACLFSGGGICSSGSSGRRSLGSGGGGVRGVVHSEGVPCRLVAHKGDACGWDELQPGGAQPPVHRLPALLLADLADDLQP